MYKKEYIERGAMIDQIIESREYNPHNNPIIAMNHRNEHNHFIVLTERQPAADVVQIVRCKDCAVPHNKWTGCPKLNGLVTPQDFYCSFAESVEGRSERIGRFRSSEPNMVVRETVNFYGPDMQLNICIEELSELIKELCKAKRGIPRLDCIAEEMADVKIILEQLGIIFGNTADVDKWYAKKVARLKERLETDKMKGSDNERY